MSGLSSIFNQADQEVVRDYAAILKEYFDYCRDQIPSCLIVNPI